MRIVMRGTYDGEDVKVRWEDGQIVAPIRMLMELQDLDFKLTGEKVGLPTGPFTKFHHLEDPRSAKILFSMVMKNFEVLSSDLPKLEYVKGRVY